VLSSECYQGCTFIKCELVFDGRPVQLIDNHFEGCSWSFEGPAGITLDFVAALCRDQPEMRAVFAKELGLHEPIVPPSGRKTADLY
jgi:hypothetical protein